MNITRAIAEKIVALIDTFGLVHGAGGTDRNFCVQQAVSKVIHHDKLNMSDKPLDCVHDQLVSLGIGLNDMIRSVGKVERAKALRRYAIAQLGTAKDFDIKEFKIRLDEKLGTDKRTINIGDLCEDLEGTQLEKAKRIANAAADVLKEMGTEGSKFMDILEEPSHQKRVEEASKLGRQIWAAQLADMGYQGFCTGGSCQKPL